MSEQNETTSSRVCRLNKVTRDRLQGFASQNGMTFHEAARTVLIQEVEDLTLLTQTQVRVLLRKGC